MRLLLGDIDDLAVTPADLSDLWFEGSPETVLLSSGSGEAVSVTPTRAASLHRPTGQTSGDAFYDLSRFLEAPCDATVSWDSGIAFLHVVSYHYCTTADVLTFGNEKRQSPMDLGRTETEAFRARAVAEEVCDDLCHRTFRATYKESRGAVQDGLLTQLEWPASRILTPGWAPMGDGLVRSCDRRYGNVGVDLEYVSGEDRGVPADVRRAVAKLAASYLMASKVPDRAVYESTDVGMTRYTLASEGSTGIPDVDAIFDRHARKRWAVL